METNQSRQTKVNWLSVAVYYGLACAISWPFFWWRDINTDSWENWNVPGFVKTWSYMWGPGLSAIIMFFLFKRKHQRTITFGGTSLIKSIAFWFIPLIALSIFGVENNEGINPHIYPIAIIGTLGFITILGEELGWRGFLQDALRPLPTMTKYFLIGFMWEIWHFTNRMRGELPQVVIKVSIWIVALSLLSFIMGKATEKSKSLFVAVTIHGWINLIAENATTTTYIIGGTSVLLWTWLILTWDKPLQFKRTK